MRNARLTLCDGLSAPHGVATGGADRKSDGSGDEDGHDNTSAAPARWRRRKGRKGWPRRKGRVWRSVSGPASRVDGDHGNS